MFRAFIAIIICSASFSELTEAQTSQTSPSPPATAPTLGPMPSLPPGIGPQPGAPNNVMPGAAGAPAMLPMPGGPAGAGAQIPAFTQPAIPQPTQHIPIPPPRSTSSSLISFLDSTAPFVQAFDFVLMLIAGVFCLRARRAPGLTILAISCFVSAIILAGFFVFGVSHGAGAFPQVAYIVARVLAPFELLLFVIGLVIVARANAGRR